MTSYPSIWAVVRQVSVFAIGAVFLVQSICGAEEPLREVFFFVSPQGNDAWSGTLRQPNSAGDDGPFATIERARDAVRALNASGAIDKTRQIGVYLRAGDYVRTTTFDLTADDSGVPGAPIVYSALPGEKVRILGGKAIHGFEPITDPAVLERLDESCRDRILQCNLASQGVNDFGSLTSRGFGRQIQASHLELFFNGKPMTLARWPNGEYAKIAAVPAGQEGGKFTYEGDRPSHWRDVSDIWVHGYWTWDWAESYEKIRSIDPQTQEIATVEPHGVYGYTAGKRYYALNILEELDQPGEWYLDRNTGMLYFYPPAALDGAEVLVSMLETPLVAVTGASHIRIQNMTFECSRGSGITVSGGEDVIVRKCRFLNLGTFAASIGAAGNTPAGKSTGIESCVIYQTGEGGVILDGGDRTTLTPAGNYVVDTEMYDFSRWVYTYRPGVLMNGVGNRVANCLIHDAPHTAILFGGNDHQIEYNDIHHVCMETHDAGAIYTGRDWTWRGNVVQYNYLHELGDGDVNAIYLDDWTSGTTVYGNICVKAGRGVLLGGGRDNLIENNIFIECRPGVHIDARGLGWAKNYFDGTTNTLFDRFKAVNASQPPYSARYPQLTTLLDDEPAVPKGNIVARNINVGGRWLDLLDNMNDTIIKFEENWTEEDPGFANSETGELKADSPVYQHGFKRIPVEKIGLLTPR